MKLFRLAALILLAAGSAAAQVAPPQVPLTGNIGPGGVFPLFNPGFVAFTSDADHTMVYPETSAYFIRLTSNVALTATRNLVAPVAAGFTYAILNATSGGQAIQVIGPTGAGVTIPNGTMLIVTCDGTNYVSSGLVAPIPNSALQNSSIPINGTTCTLGTPCTITGTGYTLGGTLSSGNVSNLQPNSSVQNIAGVDGSHTIDIRFTSTPAPGSLVRVYTLTFTASRGHNAYCVISAGDATTAQALSSQGQVTVNNIGAMGYEIYWNNESGITGLFDFILNVSCP